MANQDLQLTNFIIVLLITTTTGQLPCLENCQTSEMRRQCDNLYCKNGCVPGWYGAQCTRRCSPLCLEALCDRKSGKCTIGCKRTWMTQRYIRQCQAKISRRSTRGKCLHYKNGRCDCCESGYRGQLCDKPCTTCITIKTSNLCEYVCESGFYGVTCENQCPNTCAFGNLGKPLCRKLRNSFECVRCPLGSYGRKCDKRCSSNCKDKACHQQGGSCVHCIGNHFGEDCDKNCSKQCFGGCHRNGTCVSGCKPGFQGQMCNIHCVTNCTACGSTDTEACLLNCDSDEICSGCRYPIVCNISTRRKENNEKDKATELPISSFNLAAVLVPVFVIGFAAVLIVIALYNVRKTRKRSVTRKTPKTEISNIDLDNEASMPMIMIPEDPRISEEGEHFWLLPGLKMDQLPKLGREINPSVLIFTVLDVKEGAIDTILDRWVQYRIKGGAGSFTAGDIRSQKVISIKIPSKDSSLEINSFTKKCFGYFKSARHVLIVGLCRSDENSLQNDDPITSETDTIPYTYYGSSIIRAGGQILKASDNTLVNITRKLRTSTSKKFPEVDSISHDRPKLNLRSRKSSDKHILAFDREIEPLLDSVTGNGIESFLILHGITSNHNSTAESVLAASNAAAAVVREIIKELDSLFDSDDI